MNFGNQLLQQIQSATYQVDQNRMREKVSCGCQMWYRVPGAPTIYVYQAEVHSRYKNMVQLQLGVDHTGLRWVDMDRIEILEVRPVSEVLKQAEEE